MITITDRGVLGAQAFLRAHGTATEETLKIVPCCRGGVGITIATPTTADQKLYAFDNLLVAIDQRIVGLLDGAVIDCEEWEEADAGRIRFRIALPDGADRQN